MYNRFRFLELEKELWNSEYFFYFTAAKNNLSRSMLNYKHMSKVAQLLADGELVEHLYPTAICEIDPESSI